MNFWNGCSGWTRTNTDPLNRRVDYYYPTEQGGAPGRNLTRIFDVRSVALYRLSYEGVGKLVRPEVVATSPFRIKSPEPVCCGFRRKWSSRQDSHLHGSA